MPHDEKNDVQMSKPILSQLDKCLKFKSVRGDKNDYALCKITPRNATILDIYSVVTL